MKVIGWLSLVVLMGSFLCRPLADPDLWWHITVGRWILAHKTVPSVDYWNIFGAGQPWRAYSWSQEILYALVDDIWGERGLGAAQVLLGCILVFVMQWVFGVLANNHFFGALLAVLTAAACRSHFSLRPQTVVWIVFALVLLVAELARRKGTQRRYLGALFFLGAIWANTHLSAVFGLVAILVWSLPIRMSFANMSGPVALSLSFFAGTFVSPYVGGEWLTVMEKSNHVFAFRVLDEFKPADLTQATTMCIAFQVILLLVLTFASRRLPPRGGMLFAVIMVVTGGIVVKFAPFASIAVGALTAVWLRGAVVDSNGNLEGRGLLVGLVLLRDALMRLHPQTIGASAFFFVCIAWVNIAKAMQRPISYSLMPKSAVDFVESHSLPHPVLNEFGTGGYLIYRWSSRTGEPRHLVPIDGRTNVNPPEIWDMYQQAAQGREGWREYALKVKPQTVIWRRGSPLNSLLLESPDWCRVYESGSRPTSYVVFLTKEQFNMRRGELSSTDCE